jgi:hemoglobin
MGDTVSVPTLFERLGGEAALRAIIERFVDRLFEDPMIGFFFTKASRQRIKDKEYEFAAAHLGANVEYTGRPLTEAHSTHPIMGGHFMRRLEILKQTLREFAVPQAVFDHWVRNTERLRSAITSHEGSDCAHDVDASPRASQPPPGLHSHQSSTRRELPLVEGQRSTLADAPQDPKKATNGGSR